MNISLGWIFFLGGIVGFVRVAYARNLAELGIGRAEASEEKKPMSKLQRLLLLLLNLSLLVGGAMLIHHNHNWNPFTPCPTCKKDDGAVS